MSQQVVMLKVIKNLSSASNTLETLDSVGTIQLLADLLITNSKNAHYKVRPLIQLRLTEPKIGNFEPSAQCDIQSLSSQ